MKKLFVSALAILGLVACAKDDVVSVQDNRSAIGFNTFVENATRVDPSITNGNIKFNATTLWSCHCDILNSYSCVIVSKTILERELNL